MARGGRAWPRHFYSPLASMRTSRTLLLSHSKHVHSHTSMDHDDTAAGARREEVHFARQLSRHIISTEDGRRYARRANTLYRPWTHG
eukprot:3559890-Prymnesium_polylepis.1